MKKRSKCGPLAFGFIQKVIEEMTMRPSFIRGESVLKYCRGTKMPCIIFDDFAFHESKEKPNYNHARYMCKGGTMTKGAFGNFSENPMFTYTESWEELVAKVTGIPIEELVIYPTDIDYSNSSIHRDLTSDELKNGIKIKYTYMKPEDKCVRYVAYDANEILNMCNPKDDFYIDLKNVKYVPVKFPLPNEALYTSIFPTSIPNKTYDVKDIPSLNTKKLFDLDTRTTIVKTIPKYLNRILDRLDEKKDFVIMTTTPNLKGTSKWDMNKHIEHELYKRQPYGNQPLRPDTKYHARICRVDSNHQPVSDWVDVSHLVNIKTSNTMEPFRYVFTSRYFPGYVCNVGNEGERIDKVNNELEMIYIGCNSNKELMICRRGIGEYMKWLENTYKDTDFYHSDKFTKTMKRFNWIWFEIKVRVNSTYGFPISDTFRTISQMDFKNTTKASRHMFTDLNIQKCWHVDPWHIDCKPKKEVPVEGATQTISVTLPKGLIYEFLGKETIDPEKHIVKYDARGKIIEFIPGIKKVTKENAEGLFVAWPDEKEKKIYVGISRLHEGDVFDFSVGITTAMTEALKGNCRVPRKYYAHFNKFLTRCRCYYEQLQDPEWHISLYESIEIVRKENANG